MRILISLTYYRPHYSGLTIYTERLARGLARLGHEVTVLTSRFDSSLPAVEEKDGVRIIRPAVAMRLSKGVIMPGMPFVARKILRDVDVVNVHLPQMDAAYISWMAQGAGLPVVATYHCDLSLPKGVIHWIANQGANFASHLTAQASARIVTNTQDYAVNSRFLTKYLDKTAYIPTPIELPSVNETIVEAFRAKYQINPGERIIGMNARLATEKGVEYLIEAMPAILEKYPTARVLYVGQYQNLLGEERYAAKLAPMIERLGKHWAFLGVLSPEEQAAFFHVIEVLVLPSINSTESFGMVQVEAMICGTPVVASDLPGVRCAVQETGMGRIVSPRDARGIAAAVLNILQQPDLYTGDTTLVQQRYSPEAVSRQYEALFEELIKVR